MNNVTKIDEFFNSYMLEQIGELVDAYKNKLSKEEFMKLVEMIYDRKTEDLVEYEEQIFPDKHINKDYQQGEMYITNKDLARKAMQDEFDSKSNMKENVGAAVTGNGGGMGAVVSAQASASPGQTTGGGDGFSTPVAGDSYGDGGGVGSGDIGSGWSKSKANNKNKKKKRKKGKKGKTAKATKSTDATKSMGKGINNTFDINNYKQGPNIESFTEFSKKAKKKK